MDNAVRSIRRSPLTDPAARQAVQNAEDDMAAAFKSQDAGATIDTVLGFGQSAALTYGEPVADLASPNVVEDYLFLQEKLLRGPQGVGQHRGPAAHAEPAAHAGQGERAGGGEAKRVPHDHDERGGDEAP